MHFRLLKGPGITRSIHKAMDTTDQPILVNVPQSMFRKPSRHLPVENDEALKMTAVNLVVRRMGSTNFDGRFQCYANVRLCALIPAFGSPNSGTCDYSIC